MPIIIAGIRTATVWVVGIATLSTPVGATSLGNYIFSGLQTQNYTAVLVGCAAAASLALILDGLIRVMEIAVSRRKRALIGFAGPRVIEQTIRQKLPEGFQRSEFLLDKGFLDAIVPRKDLKSYLAHALDFLSP